MSSSRTRETLNYYHDNNSPLREPPNNDCVEVKTDQAIQYTVGEKECYRLLPPISDQEKIQTWKYSTHALSDTSPVFVSPNVSNCHTVLIYESESNKFWMLHVSPSSLDGVHAFGYPVKNAYKDISPNYDNPMLGIENLYLRLADYENYKDKEKLTTIPSKLAAVEVVVLDVRGNCDIDKLLSIIPAETVNILPTDGIQVPDDDIMFADEEKPFLYNVCFDPTTNSVGVMQGDTYIEYKNVFRDLNLDIYKASTKDFVQALRDEIHRITYDETHFTNYELDQKKIEILYKLIDYVNLNRDRYPSDILKSWIQENINDYKILKQNRVGFLNTFVGNTLWKPKIVSTLDTYLKEHETEKSERKSETVKNQKPKN